MDLVADFHVNVREQFLAQPQPLLLPILDLRDHAPPSLISEV